MLTNSARRLLAGFGVVGAVVAATATPAVGQSKSGDTFYANSVIVAPGGTEKYVSLYAFGEKPFVDYTVTVDRSKISSFADVSIPKGYPGCKESGQLLTCVVKDDPEPDFDLLDLQVVARDQAKVGAEGQLSLTVTATGHATATVTSTIEVGEGVDLAADAELTVSGKPGSAVQTPLSVANVGEVTTHGSVLFLTNSYAVHSAKRYTNCSYLDDLYDGAAFCTFDDDLAPGKAVQVDDSFALAIAADVWAPSAQKAGALWFTPADWKEFLSSVGDPGDLGKKGTDGVLRLVPATPAQARSLGQTDKNPWNNGTDITMQVTGNQQADLTAVGASAAGTVGKQVKVTVGYTNNGPAMVGAGAGQSLETATLVTVPKGTTVVTAPEDCAPGDATGETGDYGQAGAPSYFCFSYQPVKKGESLSYDFGLRIDAATVIAGQVKLIHYFGDGPRNDLNPANDVAKIEINPVGQGGGQGGGILPITGSSTGVIAGLGALLLAAGVVGFVLARRRRTRFVA